MTANATTPAKLDKEAATPTKAVAPAPTTAVATAGPVAAGFDNVDASEYALPTIKLWAKMTKADVEGGKLGQFYDVTTAKAIGDSLRFSLLALRNVSYTDEKTGKIKRYKHLLIVPNGETMPKMLVLSVSSFSDFSRLMTAALQESQRLGGAPLFSIDIEAKTQVKENDDGQFAVATFEIHGQLPKDQQTTAAILYDEHGVSFARQQDTSHDDVIAAEDLAA